MSIEIKRSRSILIALCFALLFTLPAMAMLKYRRASQLFTDYQNSTGCASPNALPASEASSGGCRDVAAVVTGKSETSGKSARYTLHCKLVDGTTRDIPMEEKYWQPIPGGSPLTIRLWRDKSRLIFTGSQYLPTKNNPQSLVDDSILTLEVSIAGFALVVLVYMYQLYRIRRRKRDVNEMAAAQGE